MCSSNSALTEPIRSVLWKLAYKQLGPEDWKKLALHWAFSYEQIKAIEHQYTGIKQISLFTFDEERIIRKKRVVYFIFKQYFAIGGPWIAKIT